jgi:hypothetical protein
MNAIKYLAAMMAIGFLVITVRAQDPNSTSANTQDRVGRVITADPPANTSVNGVGPITPLVAERNSVSPEVKNRLQDFRRQADAYVQQQEDLRKQLLGAATDAERERIRQQLRTVREQWLEIQRQVREDTKERAAELIQQMPNRRELLREAAQEKAAEVKNGVQGQIQDHKRRNGE